ncbi:MAG: von Willebrand factor type A domain-containing protein, partial [Tannerella sp.]|nr:von Willebrand factor type A domain-containing protein [Tannerella sp.]
MKTNFILLILSVLTTCKTVGQPRNISGTVSDSQGPLTGVNVTVNGTSEVAVTDLNGKYSVTARKNNTLVFSLAGYITKKAKVKNSDTVNVELIVDPKLKTLVDIKASIQQDEEIALDMAVENKVLMRKVSALAYSRAPVNMPESREEYSNAPENRFKSPLEEPLSTFSADVDAASYGNMRRIINQGVKPEPEAIRIEELINYFDYKIPAPKGKDPVNIVTETGKCPWNKQHRLLRIGLKAREIPSENLPPSNFVFLIDVSGSMYGPERLDLVKSSLKLLVNNLRDKDRVAIVVYAGAAGQVLPSTPGSDRQKIKDALENLTAGGSTAGGEGIKLAYKTAKNNFIKEGNNRVILCTDGDFNVGVSSVEGLETLIENERKSGVFLTVLGYGMGNYKDDRMQTLAQKGNGNHAYIDNLQEANKVLVNEFGGTLFTVAKDVKLQVEFNPAHVQAYRLVGYETR